jgi:Zn-dependent protease
MDRAGIMSQYDDRFEPRSFPEPDPEYSPIRRRRTPRELLGMLLAPLVLVIGLVLKFGVFSLKFFGIFLAIGVYALIWGWRFAIGFVLMILVHELGHFFEARRQGLHPSLPVFIPFLGAYVAIKDAPFDPWRNALVSLWGPIAGGLAALAALILGEALDSRLLLALAYAGFLLNLFNLLPIGFLDGGFVLRSFRLLRRGAGDRDPARARRRGWTVGVLYGALALALVVGMVAAHVPQDRL